MAAPKSTKPTAGISLGAAFASDGPEPPGPELPRWPLRLGSPEAPAGGPDGACVITHGQLVMVKVVGEDTV